MFFLFILFFLLPLIGANPLLIASIYGEKYTDKCLDDCFDSASLNTLLFLNNANLTNFLIELSTTCPKARACLLNCKTDKSTQVSQFITAVCIDGLEKDVKSLEKCFNDDAPAVYSTCGSICGTLDEVKNFTELSSGDLSKSEEFESNLGNACEVVKCNSRCSAQLFNDACDKVDDVSPGQTVKRVIDAIFASVIKNLGNDTDPVNKAVPDQCNYLYLPEVLFNLKKDQLSLTVLEGHSDSNKTHFHITHEHDTVEKIVDKAHGELKNSLQVLQEKLVQKQFSLLTEEEKLIKKRAKKLELETEIARHLNNSTTEL